MARNDGGTGQRWRMTGGSFGGSTIGLVPVDRVDAADAVDAAVTAAFAERGFTEPVIRTKAPARGATCDRCPLHPSASPACADQLRPRGSTRPECDGWDRN